MYILDEPKVCLDDALRMFVGCFIGGGCFRHVYEYALDPKNLVVKIEFSSHNRFQNAIEWDVWDQVQYTKWAQWFAPCVAVSPCAQVLIQHRTHPLPPDMAPKKLPNFFTDLKYQNFGLLNGKVVAHDYGGNLFVDRGLGAARMKNVQKDWWSI